MDEPYIVYISTKLLILKIRLYELKIFFSLLLMISNGLLALPHKEPGGWGELLSFLIHPHSLSPPCARHRDEKEGVDSRPLEDEAVHRGIQYLQPGSTDFFSLRFHVYVASFSVKEVFTFFLKGNIGGFFKKQITPVTDLVSKLQSTVTVYPSAGGFCTK